MLRDLAPADAATLAHALVSLRLVETDDCCAEAGPISASRAQLHALAEMAEWHRLPTEAVDRLRCLGDRGVVGSQVEYIDFLLDRQ